MFQTLTHIIAMVLRNLMLRKLRASSLLAALMLLCVIISIPELFVYSNSDQLSERHMAEADDFVTAGLSKRFPHQWSKGERDPYFNLTLVGDEKSPGHNGDSVILNEEQSKVAQKQSELVGWSALVSDMVPLYRAIPDRRNADCRNLKYDENLPSASVIIIMRNEETSVVLRTITSVLTTSPRNLLKEIILVDDYSESASTKFLLPRAIEFLFPSLVKLYRNKAELGMVKSRIVGADRATGDVLVFLDAHMELGEGWLEPYLQRIKEDYKNVVIPTLDMIHYQHFGVSGASKVLYINTMDWSLNHVFREIFFTSIQSSLKSDSDSIPAATMCGCCFGIHRNWWLELGKYDTGFIIWGGENLEISFKIWMCGGRMDVSPCSHQAHLYKYWVGRGSANPDYYQVNRKRLAEVWLDEYRNIVYQKYPDVERSNEGDLSEVISLRKRLQCQSFKWYLQNVIPDLYVSTLKAKARNGLKNDKQICLDIMNQQPPYFPKLYYDCHNGTTQNFEWTDENDIRVNEIWCLEFQPDSATVALLTCSRNDQQKWTHDGPKTSIHPLTNLQNCLSYNDNSEAIIEKCDISNSKQSWQFGSYASND